MLKKTEPAQAMEQETLLQIRKIQEELQNLYVITQNLQQRVDSGLYNILDSELEKLLGFDRDS